MTTALILVPSQGLVVSDGRISARGSRASLGLYFFFHCGPAAEREREGEVLALVNIQDSS